jgi:2-keto-4-pentenoate hydratase
MTDSALNAQIAERIRNAYTEGPVAPIASEIGPQNVAAAYAIQSLNTDHWVASGRRIVGRKIGLTSPAVQKQLGVDQPDFGVLFGDMLIDEDGELPRGRLIQPKVEAEIALVLGRDLPGSNISIHDVLRATEYVLPALEVVDSRIQNWRIGIADTIADNASSGMFVLASMPVSAQRLDLRACGMVLETDGRVASLGVGAACLGHPLNAVRWLARALAERGNPLCAGDIVLSGALGPMVPLDGVRHVSATIGGLGTVRLSLEP